MALTVDRIAGDAWILVVEDGDRLHHELVSLLMQTACDLGVVRSASTAEQAQTLFHAQCAPTVAFVDIPLPGRSGLELVPTLPAETRVVFVTAYDRFAVEAFDRGAVDYLLKPRVAEKPVAAAEPRRRLSGPLIDCGQPSRGLAGRTGRVGRWRAAVAVPAGRPAHQGCVASSAQEVPGLSGRPGQAQLNTRSVSRRVAWRLQQPRCPRERVRGERGQGITGPWRPRL